MEQGQLTKGWLAKETNIIIHWEYLLHTNIVNAVKNMLRSRRRCISQNNDMFLVRETLDISVMKVTS
uniref:Uncharacterized protein n=1 Tax=Octopus bimaculoides TaxID=37653 RepID=A0A0L8FL31_OCTBM